VVVLLRELGTRRRKLKADEAFPTIGLLWALRRRVFQIVDVGYQATRRAEIERTQTAKRIGEW
jgi:hypothetical protein